MKHTNAWIGLTLISLLGCGSQTPPSAIAPKAVADGASDARTASASASSKPTLAQARKGFVTQPRPSLFQTGPAPVPPQDVFRLIHYDAPVGPLAAYVSPDPGDGRKRPAILWITGGDCNTIDDVWSDAAPDDDQTAVAYRRAEIVMMFPSLRGGNDNPGAREGGLGEVDDVLSAADFLARLPYVDPERIYLGGHSTGGTLALLVAECSNRFRAIFAFGPAHDPRVYDPASTPFDVTDQREVALRAPFLWLHGVHTPTFVIEGTEGNIEPLELMAGATNNPAVRFLAVTGADHFNVLAPANEAIARKILEDHGATSNINLTEDELIGQ